LGFCRCNVNPTVLGAYAWGERQNGFGRNEASRTFELHDAKSRSDLTKDYVGLCMRKFICSVRTLRGLEHQEMFHTAETIRSCTADDVRDARLYWPSAGKLVWTTYGTGSRLWV
jgi:hypothetical protein